MFEDLNSQRKTRSFRNMSFLETNQARSSPHEEREGLDRPIRQGKTQVAAVGVGGVEGADAVGEVKTGRGMPVTELSRTRTRHRGEIITGSEVTTRRWVGQDRRPHSTVANGTSVCGYRHRRDFRIQMEWMQRCSNDGI